MAGATRKMSGTTSARRDYDRWFGSTMARSWSRPRYVTQLASLFAGEFFLLDPAAPFDPSLPPELKASFPNARAAVLRLKKSDQAVPDGTLRKIQDCVVPPPRRARMSFDEIRRGYQQADILGAAAVAAHPDAGNLWIVYNRLIVAQMGLWKITAEPIHFRKALAYATRGLALDPPPGTALVPRLCLARQALRQPEHDPTEVIESFLEARPPGASPGPSLAAAALLALDADDRSLHEQSREIILRRHREDPMMWTFVNFLLNRYHRYQIFRAPFVSERSFGRRQDYFLSRGRSCEFPRTISATLRKLDGSTFRVPDDFGQRWTALLIHGQAVEEQRAPLFRDLDFLRRYAETRPRNDLQVAVSLTADDLDRTRSFLEENPLAIPTLVVPGGPAHPFVRELGILSEDEVSNLVLFRPDGSVAAFASGLTMQTKARGSFVKNIMAWQDEAKVMAALAKGDLARARELAFIFAPPTGPGSGETESSRSNKPLVSLPHLRARAHVHLARGDFEAALRDAQEVVDRQTEIDAAMSFRTEELEKALKFRALVLQKKDGSSK